MIGTNATGKEGRKPPLTVHRQNDRYAQIAEFAKSHVIV
jgi:hypothetical protein